MVGVPSGHFVFLFIMGTCTGNLLDILHNYETLKSSDIGSRVRRSADPNPAFHMREVWFSALGRSFHMYLKQSHVLSDDFQAKVLHQNGTSTHFTVDKSQFLSGKLKDDDKSEVKVHWEGDHVMTASIETNEDTYVVEPSWRHLPLCDNYSMIAYKESDVKWHVGGVKGGVSGKLCGVDNRNMNVSVDDIRRMSDRKDDGDIVRLYPSPDYLFDKRRYKRHITCVGSHLMCKLTVVADYRFFKNIGKSDRYYTSGYITSLIDRVNSYYQRTRFPDNGAAIDAFGLGFELAEMIILDSYTNTRGQHYNTEDRVNNIDKVLNVFGDVHYRHFADVCLAHLFTYQQFPGKLGFAYIAAARGSTVGGICSRSGYFGGKLRAVNTGVSSFQNPGGSTAATLQATITVTHGHNWGAEHDPSTTECSPWFNGKYIMHPNVLSGNDRNNKYFSRCSKQYIYNVLREKGYRCLSERSAAQGFSLCGNGRIDGDEECDAGYDGDQCCEKTCKLKEGAVCSYTNYPCCNVNCQIAPSNKTCISSLDNFDCKKEAKCSGKSLNCPEPENKDDNSTCNHGKCRDGICLDVCQQNNELACACTEETTACMECCGNSTHCHTIKNSKQLPDGSPCFNGFCKKGKCEKATNFISRLYTFIEHISIDYIVQFMRNNIVWVILLLCVILWLICIAIINRYDCKIEKRDKPLRDRMTLMKDEPVLSWTEVTKPKFKHTRQ